MIEAILDTRNIEYALKQVCSNKGASGVDGMQTDELRDFISTHWSAFKEELLSGTYQPSAVRKVEIPKPQGGTRMLGIPTVKGLSFVRYADDCSIYVKSAKAAARVMSSITKYLEGDLLVKGKPREKQN
ncbi:MAG: hypothetical protein IPL55_24220 [Saprospiraceae bacterium]|nr:hypothetical protein [Saprospiraceae bacterium]